MTLLKEPPENNGRFPFATQKSFPSIDNLIPITVFCPLNGTFFSIISYQLNLKKKNKTKSIFHYIHKKKRNKKSNFCKIIESNLSQTYRFNIATINFQSYLHLDGNKKELMRTREHENKINGRLAKLPGERSFTSAFSFPSFVGFSFSSPIASYVACI